MFREGDNFGQYLKISSLSNNPNTEHGIPNNTSLAMLHFTSILHMHMSLNSSYFRPLIVPFIYPLVFASGLGDLGSILGHVIPEILKWYLILPCLTLSNITYVSRVKWSNPEKGVAPSPTPQCSSY